MRKSFACRKQLTASQQPARASSIAAARADAVAAQMQDAHELRCGSVAAAERAYALGYASVALETICDATHASDATPVSYTHLTLPTKA